MPSFALRGGAVGFGGRELAVQLGELLLGQRRSVGEEETGLGAEGFNRRFRFLHLDAQFRDLLGKPFRGFVVDARTLLDLLREENALWQAVQA